MAIIKNKELESMSSEEKSKKLTELRKELMKLRSQVARGTPPENPGKIRTIRRTIARLYSFTKNQKEVNIKPNE